MYNGPVRVRLGRGAISPRMQSFSFQFTIKASIIAAVCNICRERYLGPGRNKSARAAAAACLPACRRRRVAVTQKPPARRGKDDRSEKGVSVVTLVLGYSFPPLTIIDLERKGRKMEPISLADVRSDERPTICNLAARIATPTAQAAARRARRPNYSRNNGRES